MKQIGTRRGVRSTTAGRRRVPLGLAAALAAVSVLSACGGGGGGGGSASPSGTSPTPSAPGTPTGGPTTATGGPAPTGAATPTGALTPTSGATATTPVPPTTPAQIRSAVYFLQAGKLSPAPRTVSAPATAAGALRALLTGPNAYERAHGRGSAIPSGTSLRSLAVTARVATVDLSGRYDDGAAGPSARQRLAQVVFTATRFPGIDKVRFAVDGKAVTAFGAQHIALGRPVGRADFEDVNPVVLMESPLLGETVRAPVRVWGTANTFEAVFRLRLTDAAGRVAADVRVQATSGTGTRGTFDVTFPYHATRGGPGTLTAYYSSPADGSDVTVQRVPLNLNR